MNALPRKKPAADKLAELHVAIAKARARATAEGRKRHFYRPLPMRFRRDGFDFRQVAREGDVAIYEQTWKSNQDSAAFEVICIRRREGFQIGGRFVEPAEVYPNSEAWGVDGWTAQDKQAAFRKLREVVASFNPLARFEQKEASRIKKSST
jgi:hypothetical protein